MRLLDDSAFRALAVAAMAATLGGCAMFREDAAGLQGGALPDREIVANGPQADYPVVLGDPFKIDGQEFVPADTASYDAVGYAAADSGGGEGITVAHKTLPLPSYVELTELETGRTIVARVERRGPMTTSRVVALSPGAMVALGASDGTPVRVRRINPPETDRAELRAGRKASDRMDTPPSLLGVLKRKLPTPASSPVSLASAPVASKPTVSASGAATVQVPTSPVARPALDDRRANSAYPLAGAAPTPVRAVREERQVAQPKASDPANEGSGGFIVQAAAFSNKASADKAASRVGGFVTKVGSIYRVRTGPYVTRGQAEAALAKVREAGYSDARVFTAG